MPFYLAIGVEYDRVMDSSPTELKPFVTAHELKTKNRDEELWRMGIYVENAVAVAVDHCLNGRKANSKYMEKPLLVEAAERKRIENLTQEEKTEYVKMLFKGLEIRKKNFEITHRD